MAELEAPLHSLGRSRRVPGLSEFAALAENLPEAAWIADADGWIYWFNRRWYEYTGTTPEQMEGWGWQSVHDPKTLPDVLVRWQHSIATGEPFEMVFPLRGADGIYRPFLTRVRPVRDHAGATVHWIGSNTEVTEQERQRQLLQTLNESASIVAAELSLDRLVQAVTDAGVRLTGAEFGAFFYNVINERGEGYTLYAISGVPRERFSRFPMPRNTHVFEPTFRGTGVVRSDDITTDVRYGHNPPYEGMPDGHLPVKSYLAVPVISRSGEVLGGLFFGHGAPARFTRHHEELIVGVAAQTAIGIDNARLYEKAQEELARRKKVEEARQILIRELNHRVKNVFAVVAGIASTSAGSASSPAELADKLNARILALARAHELIYAAHTEPAETESSAQLRELVRAALMPHARDAQRILKGPDLEIRPSAVTSLALALHELATNAVKYGALSSPEGKVVVTWSVREQGLELLWSETGGPRIDGPPHRTGFGTQLIELSATGNLAGETQYCWEETGLRFNLRAPLDRLQPARPRQA